MTENETKQIPEARLIGLKGVQSDLEFKIQTDTIYIGRVSGNDIVLDDTSVSSQHAMITMENDTYIISALDSKNGIEVNGKAVTKRLLHNGDKLKVGGTTFRFVLEPPAREVGLQVKKKVGSTNQVRVAIYISGFLIALTILLELVSTTSIHEPGPELQTNEIPYISFDSMKAQLEDNGMAESISPSEAEQFYRNGVVYYDSDQFRKAFTEFWKAARLDSKNEKYKTSMKNALDQLNDEIETHVHLGKVHRDQLRYKECIKEWEYALFLIKDEKSPHYNEIHHDIHIIVKRLAEHNASY